MTEPKGRFYVYVLRERGGCIAYVGKGSKSRLSVQKKKHGLDGEIVKRFASEAAAYDYERKLILAERPRMNKCAGGNGSKAQKQRRQAWEIEMDRVGTRVYAARAIIQFGAALEQYMSKATIERIRAVANSCS